MNGETACQPATRRLKTVGFPGTLMISDEETGITHVFSSLFLIVDKWKIQYRLKIKRCEFHIDMISVTIAKRLHERRY